MTMTVSFMSANYVAREVGYAMHGWGHGDEATNDAFRPLETYEQKLGELFGDIRGLGFTAVDVWGAHLRPDWATDEHVAIARRLLDDHGLEVASYEIFVGPDHVARACEIAVALGTGLLCGFVPLDQPELLRRHGLRVGLENHPEKTPAELLEKTGGLPEAGACVDTGWFATQGYDPARAIEELGDRVFHVHLKDVLREGEPHDTCRWGEGIVDIEACVEALRRIGYAGAISVEHEPEHEDPSEDIGAMREQLEGWLR
jgi:sugar phosphate isomerase/epimerase